MASTQGSDLLAGRYEVGELIGRGGMGEVYAGRDLRLHRDVAIKRMREDLADRPRMRRRVEAEARMAASLSHPNTVAVYDTGVDEGHPFLVMERLDGRTLNDEIARGPLSEVRVREIGVQVLAALEAAHARGLIHRDIKPSNVLLAADGTWKVADFGIAKSLEADTTITRTGELIGSPSYLAPECLTGASASPDSDIYSLGVLLYEALTARRPFDGDNPLQLALAVRQGSPPPLEEQRADVDPVLCATIREAMEVDPKARPSARQMGDAIRGAPVARPTVLLDPVVPDTMPAESAETRPGESANQTRPIHPGGTAEEPERTQHRAIAGRLRSARVLVIVGLAVVAMVAIFAVATIGGDPAGQAGRERPGAGGPSAEVPVPLEDALERLEAAVRP